MKLTGRFPAAKRSPNGVKNEGFGLRRHRREKLLLHYSFSGNRQQRNRCTAGTISLFLLAKMKKYRIAVIEGDGIGKEVVPEGIRVIDAAARKAGIQFEWQQFPWSCGYYQETGKMMPEDGL